MAIVNLDAPLYLQLNKGGAYFRLFALRSIVARSTEGNRPPSHAIADWRAARRYGFDNWAASHGALDQGSNTQTVWRGGKSVEVKTPIWYCHTGEQFRNEQDAHEVWRMDHTGWHADPDGRVLYVGIVGQLTHGRYIAGYRISDSGERVYFGTAFDDDESAARYADSEAERLAEREYAHQERYHAAQELRESIVEKGRDVDMAFKLRHTDGYDSACDYRALDEMIADLRADKMHLVDSYSDIEV